LVHGSSFIATIVVSLALAYAGGMAARTLRLPPLVGYLFAGIVVGPFTPGFVADQKLTAELAEIGVALLLFGVGLHFSLADLAAVWRIAVPGALVQVTASTALGFAVGGWLGLPPFPAVLLGLSLAIASTAVATRALEERGRLRTLPGRAALGWLVMQDIIIILALVLLPDSANFAGDTVLDLLLKVGRKLLELAGFVIVVLLVGRRFIPWALARTARDGSHELFRLAVIVVALGVAYGSSVLIGVSLALGAFFAGIVVAESDVSDQAAAESVPVQQIFTVLFFVSVGMLFDPMVLVRAPLTLLGLVATIIVGNGVLTFVLLAALRMAPRTAASVAATLAQIGEFSFILTGLAVGRALLPGEMRDLVLAAALVSILVNPFLWGIADKAAALIESSPRLRRWQAGAKEAQARHAVPQLEDHAIIIGHGRVGSVVAAELAREGVPYVVIEQNLKLAQQLRREGVQVVYGDAGWPEVLGAARPEAARLLVIAVPERGPVRRIVAAAREANPELDVVVRTHSDEEAAWLARQAVGYAVMGERHTANEISDYALKSFGRSPRPRRAV
jgi:monovalent cation:H+ antiporter-2, CPA2 family